MNPSSARSSEYCKGHQVCRKATHQVIAAILIWALNATNVQVLRADCTSPTPGFPPGIGGSSSVGCFVRYKVAEHWKNKCGFPEFIQQTPHRTRIYARQSTVYNTSFSSTNNTPQGGSSECMYSPGNYFDNVTDSENLTQDEQTDKITCAYSLSYSGAYHNVEESDDLRPTVCDNPYDNCAADYTSEHYAKYDDSASASLCTINGNPQWCWVGSILRTNLIFCTSCPCANVYNDYQVSGSVDPYTIPISPPIFSAPRTVYEPTFEKFELYQDGGSSIETITLTNEYTDLDHYQIILGMIGPFSDWYSPSASSDLIMLRCAYSVNDETHVFGDLQEMKYQFGVVGTQAGVAYTISYDLITWDIPTGSITVRHKTAQTIGSGDASGTVYSHELLEPPPYWDNSDSGGMVITWVDNVSVSTSGSGALAGSGPLLNTASGSGCTSCGSGLLANGAVPGGVFANFGLGQATNGYTAGVLGISEAMPSLGIATTSNLWSSASTPDVVQILLANVLRQVRTPQVFVDIVTVDPFSYELRYYQPSQFSSTTNDSGVYTPIGSPTPFVTFKVQNPDASTNTFNRIRITETRGTSVNTYDYTYTAATGTWVIDYPGALRQDQIVNTVVTNLDGTYTRTVTITVRVPSGADQLKVKRVYQKFGANPGGFEALVQETLNPDTNPQTTTYTYDGNALAYGNHVPIKSLTRPDGSWEYYVYINDGTGHLYRTFTSFGDQAMPTSDPADTSPYRYVQYDYSPVNPSDNGTRFPDSPRTVSTYLFNQLISQNYLAILPGEIDDIRCQTPGAAWNASDNLVTVTKFFTAGSNSNKVQSVLQPNGTMSIYAYGQAVDGGQTNTAWSGQPDAGRVNIIDGTKDVTVLGPVGQLITHTNLDIASGMILARDTYGNYDTLNRPQQVTHLDGTTEFTYYACCGIDNSIDKDGVVTTYTYDAMKRQVASIRLGIVTTNSLDPMGRVVCTTRIGTDATQVVAAKSQYDTAGRLINQTNGLGGVTSYFESTNANGSLIQATTYPDGGTATNYYFLDGSLKKVSGTAVRTVQYQYGLDGDGLYTSEIKVASDGTTNEWMKTSTDFAGRPYKVLYPGNAFSVSSYNTVGQLFKETDPDGVITLYQYNAKGELAYTALDTNRNGTIDFSGIDRITSTISDVTTDSGFNVRRTRTYVWDILSANSSNLVSVSEISTDGLRSWNKVYRDPSTPVVSSSLTVFASGGNRYVTNTAPNNSFSVSAYLNGRLVSVTRKGSDGSQVTQTSYGYDAHGRQNTVTDARNGTTTTTFNNADLTSTLTTPNPIGFPWGSQTTTTYYDKMLRATNVVNPDGASVFSEFHLTGELKRNFGSRIYPVSYGYDYAGRLKYMTNWGAFSSGGSPRVTTWNYNASRGWLDSKTYDGSTPGPSYTYSSAGRLKTRSWARGITSTYTLDNLGIVSAISYSDSTPGVTYTFDRLGQQRTILRNGMTTTLTNNLAHQLMGESYAGGTLAGLSVSNRYDQWLRRTNLTILNSTTPLVQHAFGYDYASRLQTVTDNSTTTAYSATYSYLANSPLVGQIQYKQSSTLRMSTGKFYDYLNRLTLISNAPTAGTPVLFGYSYDNANQRTGCRLADGSYWSFRYDSLGQVVSAHKFWPDQTPVAGQQFDYAFDTIGNRTQVLSGGDQNGLNMRSNSYSPNNLNQYTQRSVPGNVDIMGVAFATNTVTVNGQSPYRKGEYFRQQLDVNNSSAAQWTSVTNSSPGQLSLTGNQFVPKTPENFGYDADGNLTSDGRWTYSWDGENRLIQMVANTLVGPQQLIKLEYDAKSRRIRKQVWPNTTGSGNPTNDVKFVYDGWNLIGQMTTNNSLICASMWGSDLSGSGQGAGGVGGLVELVYYGSSPTNVFVAFDGNGNVSALVNATNGTSNAQYEYGPFGEVIRATGAMAKINPFRFSTKYQDDESDLVYYGYRYYVASAGRWLSRDPEAEEASNNLYEFVGNGPVKTVDFLGRFALDTKQRLVFMGKCEMVILYGHGSGLKDWHWKWRYPDAECAAGTAVLCWPAVNVDGLADGMNLWTEWGGERVDEANWEKVFWGLPATGPDFFEGSLHFHLPNANKVLVRVGADALARASQICKTTRCSCRSVRISYVEIDKNGRPMNPKKAFDGVPVMTDLFVPCSGDGHPIPCN
jgi:RHS repeat-associated protein